MLYLLRRSIGSITFDDRKIEFEDRMLKNDNPSIWWSTAHSSISAFPGLYRKKFIFDFVDASNEYSLT
jgi:hypothetical protein